MFEVEERAGRPRFVLHSTPVLHIELYIQDVPGTVDRSAASLSLPDGVAAAGRRPPAGRLRSLPRPAGEVRRHHTAPAPGTLSFQTSPVEHRPSKYKLHQQLGNPASSRRRQSHAPDKMTASASTHVRVKILNLLQAGELGGVLQLAGRLGRIEHQDPVLLDLISTVRARLDQLEEEGDQQQEEGEEVDDVESSEESSGSEGEVESGEELELQQQEEDDGDDADVSDVEDEEHINTDTSDSGICVSD